MKNSNIWQPPKTIDDLYSKTDNNQFSGINQPTAGARVEKELAAGKAPIQLYSLATPNGQKVSILLEELVEAGVNCNYDAHYINILEGDQFTSGFVKINPNSKIPALLDNDGPNGKPIRLFESGSICLYLAEKFGKFIPNDLRLKHEMFNWVFWQMGSQGPMTGQFGHFFSYAPDELCETRDYGTARYGMEAQRLTDVLDRALEGRRYLLGEDYSLADIICLPWFLTLRQGYQHKSDLGSGDFLKMDRYTQVNRWADSILQRPAVKRGLRVCHWLEQDKGSKPWIHD